jgi:hypothetical protein
MSVVLVTSHSANIGSLLASSFEDIPEPAYEATGPLSISKERSAHEIDAFERAYGSPTQFQRLKPEATPSYIYKSAKIVTTNIAD